MRRVWGGGAALVALVVVVAAAVVAAILLTPRPWVLAVGAPGDAYVIENSFAPEGGAAAPLRWSRETMVLRLYGAYAGPTSLELRLYRDAAGTLGRPWPVSLRAGAAALAVFAAEPGWRRYHLALPAGATLVPLTLVSPTFQPGRADPRQLGVALSALRVLPLAGAPPVAFALERAAWCATLLLLLSGAVWLLDAISGYAPQIFHHEAHEAHEGRAGGAVRGVPVPQGYAPKVFYHEAHEGHEGRIGAVGSAGRVAWLIGGLGATMAAWAWVGPRSFAWGVPTSWPGAAAGAAALVVFGLLAWLWRRDYARAHGSDVSVRIALGCSGIEIMLHLALLLPLPSLWGQLAALLLLLAPGALLALALFGAEADAAERGFLALAGAVGVLPPLLLALHALPGPLPGWLVLVVADALGLGAGWALWRGSVVSGQWSAVSGRRAVIGGQWSVVSGQWAEGGGQTSKAARPHRWLVLPLALALATRLWGLGVAEFQGDEAYALMLAKGVVHGQAEILLVHMKGPVEALLPTGGLAVTGTTSELAARLPFALAGVGLVLGVWALAGRLLGGRRGDVMGWVAAMGVACDGLLVAFGRMVQYQTVVLLLAAAALWLTWRFYAGGAARRYLAAAAFCAAVAVLAHYDGAYIAPALAWLVVAGGLRRGWRLRAWAANLALPLAVGLGLTLSFYVPFVLHEHFRQTLSHLETRSGQGGGPAALFNNLAGYAVMLSVYTTRYAAAAMGLALLATLAALLALFLRPRVVGWALAGLLVAGALLATLTPTVLASGPGVSWAGWLLIPPLLALALAPRLPVALRALVLWLAGPLVAHTFLIADPRTHFYTTHAAGWLLVAWGVATLVERLPRLRPALATVGAALLTLSLTYTGLVFLRPWPEFERAYPATLLPFFAPPGGKLPDDGLFAFPHRDGWKTVAALFQQGVLRGTMDSNQELFATGWYLRGQFKCLREPDYFLTANGATPLFIPPGYALFGTVMVDGVRATDIYSREPVAGPPQVFEAADYAAAFDAAPVPNFPLRQLLSGVVPQVRLETPWRAGFALRGFDLDRAALGPADPAFVTLYWRAAQDLPATLAPAVLVRDAAGRTVAEAAPFCSGTPPEAWHQIYANSTPFRLAPGALPPGRYTLVAGVRDLATGVWLPLASGAAQVELGALTVRE